MSAPPSSRAASEAEAPGDPQLLLGAPGVSAQAPAMSVDPPLRGEGLLRLLERGFLLLDRLVGRALPAACNPFQQTGAIAVTTLLVATVSGIVLLLWYSPSVHFA